MKDLEFLKKELKDYTFQKKEFLEGLKEFYFNDIFNPRDYVLYVDVENEDIQSILASEEELLSTNEIAFCISDKKCNILGDLWENEELKDYLSKEELEEIEFFDDEFLKRERLWDKVLEKDSFKKDFFNWLNLEEHIEILEESYQNRLMEIELEYGIIVEKIKKEI